MAQGKARIRYVFNDNSAHVASFQGLKSVCQSAHCPNRMECWSQRTATFMVLGDACTRACRFCAIKTMAKPLPPDSGEPEKLADAVSSLGLEYAVITSVTRDDLQDGGSGHFAQCIRELKRRMPRLIVEALVPDFRARMGAIGTIIRAGPDVVSHNIETVERLSPSVRDGRASYRQSLSALSLYKELSGGSLITKSGIMAGLGEREDEVEAAMNDLRGAGVDIVTIGQYLSPSKSPRHLPVKEYVSDEVFKSYERMAYRMGFRYVASGPLVRSSYKAAEPFARGLLKAGNAEAGARVN